MVVSLVRTIEAVPETGRAQLLIDQVAALPVSGVSADQAGRRIPTPWASGAHCALGACSEKGIVPWVVQPL